MSSISLTVNGRKMSGEAEDRTLLVHFLRDDLGLTGTHVGCDTSQCGACIVHVDGKAVKSCTMLAVQASGASVTTIEGIAQGQDLHPVQENFLAAGIWHPETPVLRQIRQFLVDNPQGWSRAAHDPALRRRWSLSEDGMLVRVPRGYPDDFEYRDDLRRRNFVILRALDDATMTGPRLRQTIARELAATAPFMDYLCAALDLEF
mgnify:CR=1 FL=1